MRHILIFCLLCCLSGCASRPDAFGTANGAYGLSFDHYAINVTDLQRSADFYQRVLSIDTVYNGTENDRRIWYSLGEGMALHIIETDEVDVKTPKGVHLCLAVADFDAFVDHLREEGLAFETWLGEPMQTNSRPDGVRQVYLRDPDGYWIEINDNRALWEKNRSKK